MQYYNNKKQLTTKRLKITTETLKIMIKRSKMTTKQPQRGANQLWHSTCSHADQISPTKQAQLKNKNRHMKKEP